MQNALFDIFMKKRKSFQINKNKMHSKWNANYSHYFVYDWISKLRVESKSNMVHLKINAKP